MTSEYIDDLNHVNNVVYVQWMDKVAFEHWAFLTQKDPLPQYIWVVLKHEVDYLKQAVLGDIITVKTWVGETKGFKSERLMEFYKNNQLIQNHLFSHEMYVILYYYNHIIPGMLYPSINHNM